MRPTPRPWVERAARLYPTTRAAARALGIAEETMSRLCRKFEIETPAARRRRAWHQIRPLASASQRAGVEA